MLNGNTTTMQEDYGPDVGEQMSLTNMGYYNAVIHVSTPDNILELFEPADPGEEYGRLQDIERAITFINDTLDVDAFQGAADRDVEGLIMKGIKLEKVRFRILREDWEPALDIFPRNMLQHYDPDVTYGGKKYMRITTREHPNFDYLDISIITLDHIDTEDNFKVKYYGHDGKQLTFESPHLSHALDALHGRVQDEFGEDSDIAKEVGEKSGKLIHEARTDGLVTAEELEELE